MHGGAARQQDHSSSTPKVYCFHTRLRLQAGKHAMHLGTVLQQQSHVPHLGNWMATSGAPYWPMRQTSRRPSRPRLSRRSPSTSSCRDGEAERFGLEPQGKVARGAGLQRPACSPSACE